MLTGLFHTAPVQRETRSGSAVLDFGDTPALEASVDVAGQAGIAAASRVRAWFQADTMLNNTAADHELAGECVRLVTTIPVADTGFTIKAQSRFGLWTKRFRVQWTWTI